MRSRYLVPAALSIMTAGCAGTFSPGPQEIGAVAGDAHIGVDVEPLPESIRSDWGLVLGEIDERVHSWAEEEGVASMSSDQLAGGIDQLTDAITNRDRSGSDGWLALRELFSRRQHLCESLPATHQYRNGEYCT